MNKGELTKLRIRETGFELLQSRGYHNTSMNDIVDYTGVKKGNLYFHFDSKENLVIEVLKEATRNYDAYISSRVTGITSADKLQSIIDAIFDFNCSADKFYGCIFGNMALELGGGGSELESYIRSVFGRWERMLEKHIYKGVQAGELKLREEPLALARMIIASIEGGIMLAKISGSLEPFIQCRDFIKCAINERRIT